jgi:competence protein ComEA
VDLPGGSRVVDALDAAGGALGDADLDHLNLAARVRDGERILVPHGSGAASTTTTSSPVAATTTPP